MVKEKGYERFQWRTIQSGRTLGKITRIKCPLYLFVCDKSVLQGYCTVYLSNCNKCNFDNPASIGWFGKLQFCKSIFKTKGGQSKKVMCDQFQAYIKYSCMLLARAWIVYRTRKRRSQEGRAFIIQFNYSSIIYLRFKHTEIFILQVSIQIYQDKRM